MCLFEKFAEVPRRFEARAVGDFFHAQPRGLQEMQAVAKSLLPEIFHRRGEFGRLKTPYEVVLGHATALRDAVESQRVVVVVADDGDGAFDRPWLLPVFARFREHFRLTIQDPQQGLPEMPQNICRRRLVRQQVGLGFDGKEGFKNFFCQATGRHHFGKFFSPLQCRLVWPFEKKVHEHFASFHFFGVTPFDTLSACYDKKMPRFHGEIALFSGKDGRPRKDETEVQKARQFFSAKDGARRVDETAVFAGIKEWNI